MIKVLLVDDHRIVRLGVAQVLSACDDIVVAGEASTGEEALELVRGGAFDIVILDICMPGRGGLDVIKDIRQANQSIRIIILSMHSEEQYAIRSLRDGASAYLTKSCADKELITAIRRVAEGRRFITAEVAERLAYYVECESENLEPHERLASREFQVFTLIGEGKTVSEIANELSLSAKTVSTYRIRVLAKMGMKTNAQLMRYAIGHDLVPK
jgi:two-component system, NarL family, invasion response regulator UvrY